MENVKLNFDEVLKIAESFLRESLDSKWDSSGIPSWSALASGYIFNIDCHDSRDEFKQWIKNHMDNIPMWITHPYAYDIIMELYVEISMRIRNDRCGLKKTIQCDNTLRCDGPCENDINIELMEKLGISSPYSIANGAYEKSFNDLVVDEEQLMVFIMSYVEEE